MTQQSQGFIDSLLKASGVEVIPKEASWLKEHQSVARSRALAKELPKVSDEKWRFTDISPLYRTSLSCPDPEGVVDQSLLKAFYIPEATQTVVLINGVYASELSAGTTDPGVKVLNLESALKDPKLSELVREKISDKDNEDFSIFYDINNALFADILIVEVSANADRGDVIHILNVSSGKRSFNHPRVLVVAREGSSGTIIEDYIGMGGNGYMVNSVFQCSIERGAELAHIKLQRDDVTAYHLSQTTAEIQRDARYKNWSISVGALASRHDVNVIQMEVGGTSSLRGLAIGNGKRLVDTHSVVEHRHPNGQSSQLHKTIANDQSNIVFNGKIKVHKGAQQTNASQQNRNLILSRRASVDTKPELEIFADDVKCAHGATVGEMSDEELFYLKTRGLDETSARNLLNYAFAREVIEDNPISSITSIVESYIRQSSIVE